MGYYKNDYALFLKKFNNINDVIVSSKGTFRYNKIDKNGSYFLTYSDIYFIREKDDFAYKIPFTDIIIQERRKKNLNDDLYLIYGEDQTTKVTMFDSGAYEAANVLIKLTKPLEEEKAKLDKQRLTFKEQQEKIDIKNQKKLNSELKKIHSLRAKTEADVLEKENEIKELDQELKRRKKELNDILKQIDEKQIENDFNEIFVRHFEENITSSEINDKLSLLNLEEKDRIKNNKAVLHYGYEDRKSYINSQVKQILRSFDTECNYFFSNLTFRNYETYHNKIIKAYETLNRIYKVDEVEITKDYLQIKLEKLNLIYEKEKKIEHEREIQKEIKEQMKEEERVRRELENERKKLEKEERQFSNEVNSLFKRLEKSNNDIEKELYAEKIKQLEQKLQALEEDKKDVINRETNTRAGYVYVISNIGSFGEDVFKIGMTRRLEPYDRVKELGDASVPFGFDVHAMIFSDDAPRLENTLHRHFRSREINKVNHRKEFFRVNIDEIEHVVKTEHNNTVEFTKIAQAEQYWESKNLSDNEELIEAVNINY
ncbi:DUF4041 domain-containing protein [Staphylococcus saprophyticus]|uniref:DUF4041 domain-containing protein n=1 Tax=Staphylococcus saprophyticus TaxID=29385 RepID=UPI0024C21CEC|nr:DUF4041 domain-containing protein [Staphylococcus saprophyticus]MDK1672818.1 DUF4041 domain-containing protein [Staphylococcus saprophyticus]